MFPGTDYLLIDTDGATAEAWLAFDQPQGYSTLNDISVVLISLDTGVRVQSVPIHFNYEEECSFKTGTSSSVG